LAPRPDRYFTTKAGIVRRRLGRPGAEPKQIARARQELAKGVGIGKVARLTGLGTGTVHKLKREMTARKVKKLKLPKRRSVILGQYGGARGGPLHFGG